MKALSLQKQKALYLKARQAYYLDPDGRTVMSDEDFDALASQPSAQDREDAERWRRVEKNPLAAIDKLRKGCGTSPSCWRDEARQAIDALRAQWGDLFRAADGK